MEYKFSAARQAEAHSLYMRAYKTGAILDLPDWVFEAHKEYRREESRVRKMKNVKPHTNRSLREDRIIDAIAVELASSGQSKVKLTRTEKILVVNHLRGRGYTLAETAQVLGQDDRSVSRMLDEIDKGAVKAINLAIEAGDFDVSPDRSAL